MLPNETPAECRQVLLVFLQNGRLICLQQAVAAMMGGKAAALLAELPTTPLLSRERRFHPLGSSSQPAERPQQ